MTPLLQFIISSEMPLSGFSLIIEISRFMGQSRSHWMGIATQAQKEAAQRTPSERNPHKHEPRKILNSNRRK